MHPFNKRFDAEMQRDRGAQRKQKMRFTLRLGDFALDLLSLRDLLTIGLIGLLLAGCASAATPVSAPAEPAATATLELARDFTLPTLSGEPLTLSEQRGRWVLLNFWATWCPPCVQEMPYLNQIASERDMVVWGVNFNEPAGAAATFVEQHGITFPILTELDDITELVYKVRGLPITYVIDPNGAIAKTVIGQLDPAEFDDWLDAHAVPLRQ
jgi:thiol-disulfide isomerase/thioredoxin